MEENKSQPPTKVGNNWFFERGDGQIITCEENEAWNLMRNKSNWQRQDFKFLGMSDGKTYVETIKTAQAEKNRVEGLVAQKSSELTRYLDTLDKFKFEQLLDDSDEKVVKVKGIIAGIQKEIDLLNQEFSKGYQDVVNKAFNAELEKAKGNMIMPQNQDIMTPKGDREAIIRNMPR